MRVPISDATRRNAQKWAAIIVGRLPPRPNYTGLARNGRYADGYVGEFTFKDLLRSHHKRYQYFIRLDGHASNQPEFTVFHQGKPFTLDVKTAGERPGRDTTKWDLQTPEEQFKAHSSHLYVAARIDGKDVDFKGWVWRKEYEQRAPVWVQPRNSDKPVLTRRYPYQDLHTLEHLLESLDNEPG